jgi:hypothetical protein
MTDFPRAVLGLDAIVVGYDYRATVVIDPPAGLEDDDVETELTGATVTARILDSDGSTVIATGVTETVDAGDREVTLVIASAVTALLAPGSHYVWDVMVTTSGAKKWPVTGLGRAVVRALP